MMPSGANRNAQISDAIAMPLVGARPRIAVRVVRAAGTRRTAAAALVIVTLRQSSPMDLTWTGVAGLPSWPPPSTPAAAILSSVARPVSSIVPNTV